MGMSVPARRAREVVYDSASWVVSAACSSARDWARRTSAGRRGAERKAGGLVRVGRRVTGGGTRAVKRAGGGEGARAQEPGKCENH